MLNFLKFTHYILGCKKERNLTEIQSLTIQFKTIEERNSRYNFMEEQMNNLHLHGSFGG